MRRRGLWDHDAVSRPRGGGGGHVCLAASPGGHLAELQAASAAFSELRRVWVTGASRQADALTEAGEDVRLLPPWGRDPPGLRGLPANLQAATRGLRGGRPTLVVTTGAGLVVPFVMMARATGSELVFVESMARVTGASLTGRILARLASTVVVQWPETRAAYRRAVACRPALLEAVAGAARGEAGEGTFVSVGTRPEPFDRLLAMVDRAVAAGVLPRPVVAQSGTSTYRPQTYDADASMAPEEVARAMEAARYVVCHGGAAMIAAAIAAGRRPLVLPRRRAAGEHRTEHQAELVDRLGAVGAVVRLREEIGADELLAADEAATPDTAASNLPSVESVLRGRAEAVLGGADRPQ